MALPELVRASALRKLNAYSERRAPEHVQDEVQVEARIRGDKITIVERRAPWRPDFGPEWTESKVAQIEFHPATRTWRLFAYDRNERRVDYPFLRPTRDLDAVIDELERDPICIFGR
jgi:hypothetical protein